MKSALPHSIAVTIALSACLSTFAAMAQTSSQPVRATSSAPPPAPAAPSAPVAPAAPAAPVISAEQASYNFGMSFGEQLRRAGLTQDLSMDALLRGLKDAVGGKNLTAAENQQVGQYVRSVRDASGLRNKAAAKEFLAGNAQKNGIKSTPSGLQYKVIEAGDTNAASPKPDDQVTVQYRGKLMDGTEFDSSYANGKPAVMPANRVIKGWQEALALMKPGSTYQLFIPPELAYDMSAPPGIPPGSLLIFDVQLVSIQPAPKSN